MTSVDFSEETKKAVRKYLKSEAFIDSRTPKGKRIEFTNSLVKMLFHDTRYGVEDAILSGRRMRLFDELGEDFGINCAEAGINTFLFYNLTDKNSALLRAEHPDNLSSHFHVLYNTHKDNPSMIDPLWDLEGEIRLIKNGPPFLPKGFIYYPRSWLKVKKAKQDADRKRKVDEDALDAFASQVISGEKPKKYLLKNLDAFTKEEVIRHIKCMNAPLGFFDYYRTGQEILKGQGKPYSFECTAQTEGNHLILRVMCYGLGAGALTYERRYAPSGKQIRKKDRKVLHIFYDWVFPKGIVYTENKKKGTVHKPELVNLTHSFKSVLQLVTYIRHVMASEGEMFSEEERDECINGVQERVEEYEKAVSGSRKNFMDRFGEVIDHSEETLDQIINNKYYLIEYSLKKAKEGKDFLASITEKEGNFNFFDSWIECLYREVRPHEEKISELKGWLSYLEGASEEEQKRVLNDEVFFHRFDARKIPVQRPYTTFSKDENPLPALQKICQHQYARYKPAIDEFFSSEVCNTLVEQYKEALAIKKKAESLI